MVDKANIKVSRKWFIQSNKQKIQDVYSFKSDTDVNDLLLALLS